MQQFATVAEHVLLDIGETYTFVSGGVFRCFGVYTGGGGTVTFGDVDGNVQFVLRGSQHMLIPFIADKGLAVLSVTSDDASVVVMRTQVGS